MATACLVPDFGFGPRPDGSGGGADGGGGSALPAHCEDGEFDAGKETDVDCGKACGETCAIGQECGGDADCASRTCFEGVCSVEMTCTDGLKNESESDIDCGGAECDSCADLLGCRKAADCESGVCKLGKCAVPSCDDDVRNADESDIDCGEGCDACDLGQRCSSATDCLQPEDGSSAIVCVEKICSKTIAIAARASKEVNTEVNRVFDVNIDKDQGEVGHRLLVVAVTSLNIGTPTPDSVKYSGKLLRPLQSEVAGHDSSIVLSDGSGDKLFAGIYVLSECDLQATTLDTITVEMQVQDWAGAGMDAVLFENVNQDLSELGRSILLTSAQSVALDADELRSQSWFFGTAGNPGASFSVSSPPSPGNFGASFFSANSSYKGIATTFGPLDAGNYTFEWRSDWENKVAAGLILEPARLPAPTCP